ncbi:MAG: 2-dehydropantoate 2-reductase N-terminal domain-containing protein, partial [Pseudomonadota bacterium]
MKICIFGAGAIGGYLAAGLAASGKADVSVIARGKHLEAIRSGGLTLSKDGAETTVPVTAALDPTEIGPVDVIFNALKAHQSWE